MIRNNDHGMGVPSRAPRPGQCGPAARTAQRRRRAAGCAVVAAVMLAGCSAGHAAPRAVPGVAHRASAARSLVRVPRPDYSSPVSVAAAFYVAWASVDAVHDGPTALAARCAPLATGALERQLAASQPATAAWQAMRRDRLVSLVRVSAVTRPDGAPAPSPLRVYLRVYAERVTTTAAGRTTASDGVTLRLTRSGGRWLVSAVLFY
jgi:hypothetical protein